MNMQVSPPPSYEDFELNSNEKMQLENEKVNQKEEQLSFKEKLNEWATHTTMQGIPNIRESNSHSHRYAWMIIMVAGLGMLIYQVQDSIIKFYSYPSTVTISQEMQTELQFPALTFCNLNPIIMSALTGGSDTSAENIVSNKATQISGEAANAVSNVTVPNIGRRRKRDAPINQYTPPGTGMKSLIQNLSGIPCLAASQTHQGTLADQNDNEVSSDAGVKFYFQDLYQQLTVNKRIEYGSQLSNFLIDCTMNSKLCKPANFTTFLHPTMGPCFTFNADSSITSNLAGPLFGFQGIFFIEEDEYFGALSRTVGVKLVVHAPNRMPLPDEEGINLAPGMDTGVSVSTKYVERLKPPYTDKCKDYTSEENLAMNLYARNSSFSLPNIKMSFEACVRTCIQNFTEKICNCSNPFFPRTNSSVDPVALDEAEDLVIDNSTRIRPCPFGYCNGSMGTKYACFMEVHTKYDLDCQNSCSRECKEYDYETKVSIANWPSSSYAQQIEKKVKSRCPTIMKAMEKSSNPSNYVSVNLVKVSVYFETLSVDQTISSESYTVVQLLADFGGQFGLWMGLSVLTMFEVVELLIELFLLIWKKVHRNKKRSTWVWAVNEAQKKVDFSNDLSTKKDLSWSQTHAR